MRSRALILALALSVVVVTAVGGPHLALHALPFLAVVVLLLGGRFVGEERILAFHRARTAPRPRRAPARRWVPARPDRVVSLLARSPRTFRGPPAAAL